MDKRDIICRAVKLLEDIASEHGLREYNIIDGLERLRMEIDGNGFKNLSYEENDRLEEIIDDLTAYRRSELCRFVDEAEYKNLTRNVWDVY